MDNVAAYCNIVTWGTAFQTCSCSLESFAWKCARLLGTFGTLPRHVLKTVHGMFSISPRLLVMRAESGSVGTTYSLGLCSKLMSAWGFYPEVYAFMWDLVSTKTVTEAVKDYGGLFRLACGSYRINPNPWYLVARFHPGPDTRTFQKQRKPLVKKWSSPVKQCNYIYIYNVRYVDVRWLRKI